MGENVNFKQHISIFDQKTAAVRGQAALEMGTSCSSDSLLTVLEIDVKVVIINNIKAFNSIYPIFEQKAQICFNPSKFHCGFDCEWLKVLDYPESFARITNQAKPHVALCVIQLCAKDLVLILRVSEFLYIPNSLKRLISSSAWIKTGVGMDNDFNHCYSNFNLTGTTAHIDMSTHAAVNYQLKEPSFENLVSIHLGKPFAKGHSVKDWAREDVVLKYWEYLANDGFYSFALGVKAVFNSPSNPLKPKYSLEVDQTPEDYITLAIELSVKASILPSPKPKDVIIDKLTNTMTYNWRDNTFTAALENMVKLDEEEQDCTHSRRQEEKQAMKRVKQQLFKNICLHILGVEMVEV